MATPYTKLRLDLGFDDDETVFSNAELDAIWTDVSGAANATRKHNAALALMAMRMRNKAIALFDQTVVASSDKKSQVFDHWNRVYAEYKPDLDAVLSTRKDFARSAVRAIPRDEDTPNDA